MPSDEGADLPQSSALADRRGGPSNFSGVGFQVRATIRRAVDLLIRAGHQPTLVARIAVEPRVVDGQRQRGYDISVTEHGVRTFVEVKESPTHDEILELVAHAREAADDIIVLDAGVENVPVRNLRRVLDRAQEATDDADLRHLVDSHDDARLSRILQTAGERAREVLRGLEVNVLTRDHLDDVIDTKMRQLALPGRLDALSDRLFRMFHDGAPVRQSFEVTALLRELGDAGLAQASTLPDLSDAPESLVAALTVLTRCPVPLDSAALADGLSLTVNEVLTLLDHHVGHGTVRVDERGRLSTAQHLDAFSAAAGSRTIVGTLESLNRRATDGGATYSHQARNALELARACASFTPRTAALTFQAFDKASKATGDIRLVWDLAHVSTDALEDVFGSPMAQQEERTMAYARAQTYICGHGWCLQRTEELAQAAHYMAKAEAIANTYVEPENAAFGAKCLGRLRRLQAEKLAVNDPARAALLVESKALLTSAFQQFDALLAGGGTRFVEDRAECLALRARTRTSDLDFTGALEDVDRATDLLKGTMASKTASDLVILKAEIAKELRLELDSSLEELAQLVAQLQDSPPTQSASETLARASRTLGLILHSRVPEDPAAAQHLLQSADLYERLGMPRAKATVLWDHRTLFGAVLPNALLAAIDAESLSPSTSFLLGDIYDRGNYGVNMDDEAATALVARAKLLAEVTYPLWGDRRSAA